MDKGKENLLFDRLSVLVEAAFQEVVFKLGAPTKYMQGPDAPLAIRAVTLIEWTRQQGKLHELERLVVDAGRASPSAAPEPGTPSPLGDTEPSSLRREILTTAFATAVRRELQHLGIGGEAVGSLEARVLAQLVGGERALIGDVDSDVRRSISRMIHIFEGCASAQMFYRSAFYLSKRKVLELHRLQVGLQNAPESEATTPMSRAIALYDHLLESGRLRISTWPFDADSAPRDFSLFYCIIASMHIDLDATLRRAFPLAIQHLGIRGYASELFSNNDPNVCPYISLVSPDPGPGLAMTLSRKHLRISSSSVDFVGDMMAGKAMPLVAFCYTEPDGTGFRIQPIACRMLWP